MSELKLARIQSTFLGREDHGILTAYLHLEYAVPGGKIGASGQGFGGYDLRGALGGPFIEKVLAAVGTDDWSKLVGKMVWADSDFSKVHAITGVDTGIEFRPQTWIDEILDRAEATP